MNVDEARAVSEKKFIELQEIKTEEFFQQFLKEIDKQSKEGYFEAGLDPRNEYYINLVILEKKLSSLGFRFEYKGLHFHKYKVFWEKEPVPETKKTVLQPLFDKIRAFRKPKETKKDLPIPS